MMTASRFRGSIQIAGVGDFTVTWPATQLEVHNNNGSIVFGRYNGAYLFSGPTNSVFSNWDMLTGIGPISGTGSLYQWNQGEPWVTTAQNRILIFDTDLTGNMASTFTAIVVPEPSTYAALCGLAALVFAAYRRRNR
jgi:hypothetical protein